LSTGIDSTDPLPIFETERLRLRPLIESDAPFFCEIYGDPDAMHFVGPTLTWERAQRSFQRVLRLLRARPLERLFLMLIERSSEQAIGIGSLQSSDVHRHRVEAGMILKSPARGRGYGKEGLFALVTHAFTLFPADEVWIQHATDNSIARRVPISLGLSSSLDTAAYEVGPGKCIWSAYRHSWGPAAAPPGGLRATNP